MHSCGSGYEIQTKHNGIGDNPHNILFTVPTRSVLGRGEVKNFWIVPVSHAYI